MYALKVLHVSESEVKWYDGAVSQVLERLTRSRRSIEKRLHAGVDPDVLAPQKPTQHQALQRAAAGHICLPRRKCPAPHFQGR